MSKSKTIEVIVQIDGTLKIDAVGFQGAGCEQATRFLEEALGQETGRKRKPDFHKRARTRQRVGR